MNDLSYNELLLKLLNNDNDRQFFCDELLVNIYITLLALNNHHYSKDIFISKLEIMDDFLRKVNNLKVKIQLKRKQEEVEFLLNEIKDIYNTNQQLIDNYNKNKWDILCELDTKNPVSLTNLIDDLTMKKREFVSINDKYDTVRSRIIDLFPGSKYHIDNDILYIDNNDLSIKLDDFYIIFSYLLDSNNYPKKYVNDDINMTYIELVNNLINLIIKRKLPSEETIIPIILTYLICQDIDYLTLCTNKFNILNIRITDLYSFANKEGNKENAKWKNISIPNEYLCSKIKEISKKGMYYYKDNIFVIENIFNHVGDFKISISIQDMKEYLVQNIENIKDQSLKLD